MTRIITAIVLLVGVMGTPAHGAQTTSKEEAREIVEHGTVVATTNYMSGGTSKWVVLVIDHRLRTVGRAKTKRYLCMVTFNGQVSGCWIVE